MKEKKLVWYSHVRRMERRDYHRKSSDRMPLGKRRGGRSKNTWLYGVLEDLKDKTISESLWEDRDEWR